MSDSELQLTAQRSLQEFDDARAKPDSDLTALGKKAIDALDTFIAYWNSKPYMRPQNDDQTGGGYTDLKEYAERQVGWATEERQRVRQLLPNSENS